MVLNLHFFASSSICYFPLPPLQNMDVPIPSSERSLWSPPRGIRLVKPKKEVKKVKEFTAQDARKRLLQLLQKKLKDRNANPKIMANVFGNNRDNKF